MTILRTGDLRQQVSIQRRAGLQDSVGQAAEQWQTVFPKIWAAAEPIRGREYFAAGEQQAPVDVRFRIRYREGIEPAMRVVWRDKPYDIQAAIDIGGERVQLELMCVTGVDDGR